MFRGKVRTLCIGRKRIGGDLGLLHGRLIGWHKWRASDVEAKEGLENELRRRWSNGRVGEWTVTYVKRRKGCKMNCDVGEVTERLENEQSCDVGEQNSFSKLSVTSPTSQFILQPFRRFTYVTAHSPTLPLLHLRHSSFSNPSFASPASQALHLIHWRAAHEFYQMTR